MSLLISSEPGFSLRNRLLALEFVLAEAVCSLAAEQRWIRCAAVCWQQRRRRLPSTGVTMSDVSILSNQQSWLQLQIKRASSSCLGDCQSQRASAFPIHVYDIASLHWAHSGVWPSHSSAFLSGRTGTIELTVESFPEHQRGKPNKLRTGCNDVMGSGAALQRLRRCYGQLVIS